MPENTGGGNRFYRCIIAVVLEIFAVGNDGDQFDRDRGRQWMPTNHYPFGRMPFQVDDAQLHQLDLYSQYK
jgi:hypothetical protein